MSSGGTMMRVYAALKTRVMTGAFSPGERLDPARLSSELAASVTPIRDALHRLTGERLIDSWQHEGFRQPFVSEAGLRDLYGWSSELVAVVLRAAARGPDAAAPLARTGSFAEDAARLFAAVAERSPNHEHRAAIASLNDRCHLARLVEERIFADPGAELDELAVHVEAGRWGGARRAADAYHRRRLRHVQEIAAQLRPREGG
ncbi:GntR family transcriptional regulator [Sphingomonas canadensis]|uniref:GntR family transcriptional regulator n=1 Tax=Sphingomonas canadensis TaxID=1219257 RepID=A0ABW3H0U8_9SPHN|nr:GntR family transcriptional regulator [Sphingomonas canadensis]MCW3835021.1 GntR family transcriptional regulator [Sphingomonas canadensis]